MAGLGRRFWRLWAANALANLADGVAFVAIPLLAAALTSDPARVAGLSLVHSAVRLVVVLPIGGLVDRWDRRHLLWAANLVRALLLGALAAVVATGNASIGVLYLVFALVGVAEAAADNAALSILPDLVDHSRLDRANSQITAAQLVADEFVGPPLGSVLFGLALALPLVVTGSLYAAAALTVVSLRGAFRPAASDGARRRLWREVLDGITWMSRHRLLAALAGVGGLASVAYMATFSILVLFSRDVLGQSPAGYGFLLSSSAVGGLVGSAVVAPLRRRIGYAATIATSLLLGAASLALLAITTTVWVAAAALAAYILHAVVWGVCVTSLRQRLVPDGLRGRVNAATRLVGLVGLTVGAAIGGALGSAVSLRAPILLGSCVFVGCAVWAGWAVRRWERGEREQAQP